MVKIFEYLHASFCPFTAFLKWNATIKSNHKCIFTYNPAKNPSLYKSTLQQKLAAPHSPFYCPPNRLHDLCICEPRGRAEKPGIFIKGEGQGVANIRPCNECFDHIFVLANLYDTRKIFLDVIYAKSTPHHDSAQTRNSSSKLFTTTPNLWRRW